MQETLLPLASRITPGIFKHVNCIGGLYPGSGVSRTPVSLSNLHWNIHFADYKPAEYTSPRINGQPWADPEVGSPNFNPKWHQLDGKVNRASHICAYAIESETGRPLNPMGRTGLCGRGLLGRWGPNHAADPIVTRWKRNECGEIEKHTDSGLGILELIVIQRHDNHLWAIPGGMVDPGELVSSTLKREFMEEALNSAGDEQMLEEFFKTGTTIYKGYVDDGRNTDNAWIETVATNFHDATGEKVGGLKLTAGDDARAVKWITIDSPKKMHANHWEFVLETARILNAFHDFAE